MTENKMLVALEARLNNIGETMHKDKSGNDVFVECKIIEEKTLNVFLESSLSMLNMLLGFKNPIIMEENRAERYKDLIVQGALLNALSSHALLERGREFQAVDGDVSFESVSICNNTISNARSSGIQLGAQGQPRSISDLLMQQWELEKHWYMEKLSIIKKQAYKE